LGFSSMAMALFVSKQVDAAQLARQWERAVGLLLLVQNSWIFICLRIDRMRGMLLIMIVFEDAGR
jgi:hypothetical protein